MKVGVHVAVSEIVYVRVKEGVEVGVEVGVPERVKVRVSETV